MHARLNHQTAARFAALTLHHVTREYPNHPGHVLTGPEDLRPPHDLHPLFYGSFDWHSCVHGYWQLARLLRLFPGLPLASAIRDRFDAAFTAANVQAEIDYFMRPASGGFERPYGWAWLLALQTELHEPSADGRRRWHEMLLPLTAVIARRLVEFLPRAPYPMRPGTHVNSAFAMTLAHAYATSHGDQNLQSLIERQSRLWYLHDADCQAWEPSLNDFLSPALVEAVCMQSILPAAEFGVWIGRFLPRLGNRQPAALFTPALPADRTDGAMAHLDGLNFSRAWCFHRLAAALPPDDPHVSTLRAAADDHLAASLPHIADDYAGEHWLATFALLAMSDG